MKAVTILGATGSIGQSTLDVIAQHPDKFRVCALTAHSKVEMLLQQCRKFLPDYAVMVDENAASQLRQALRQESQTRQIEVLAGSDSLDFVAAMPECDYVMAAIVGAAGLSSSLAAARAGKRVMLANKESLVMAGRLFMQAVRDSGAELLPVDSEHNAIFQSLPDSFDSLRGKASYGIEKIFLTASGGPFRQLSVQELKNVTPAQACAHPNWSMGQKISVDSATMMNKGLEVIEASWLFQLQADDIQVLIHPQSIIHSMVAYIDGSVLAQLGYPDMKTPISYALSWPQRQSCGVNTLDLTQLAKLEFYAPDLQKFPCLGLSFEALKAGGNASIVLNAANEIAVDAFLRQQIPYLDIAHIVEHTLEQVHHVEITSMEAVYQTDHLARERANQFIQQNY